jgi:fatty acid desaturase
MIIIRRAWNRLQLIGLVSGEYIAALVTFIMYYTVIIPFAIIAQVFVDPLGLRKKRDAQWVVRKPVGTSIEEARRQS